MMKFWLTLQQQNEFSYLFGHENYQVNPTRTISRLIVHGQSYSY